MLSLPSWPTQSQICLWVLDLGDHSALSCAAECKSHIAPGANANRHSYQKLIKRSGRVNLFPETAEPPSSAPRAGQPSPEDGYCIFKSFIKRCFLKESGHCCLFCPAFWMLLTSTTLILSVAFSMIELKSL